MRKGKVSDLTQAYLELAPDRDYPPLSFERACRAQLLAQSAADEIVLPGAPTIEKTAELYRPGVRRTMGLLEWPAMRRLADRLDPSYKN